MQAMGAEIKTYSIFYAILGLFVFIFNFIGVWLCLSTKENSKKNTLLIFLLIAEMVRLKQNL